MLLFSDMTAWWRTKRGCSFRSSPRRHAEGTVLSCVRLALKPSPQKSKKRRASHQGVEPPRKAKQNPPPSPPKDHAAFEFEKQLAEVEPAICPHCSVVCCRRRASTINTSLTIPNFLRARARCPPRGNRKTTTENLCHLTWPAKSGYKRAIFWSRPAGSSLASRASRSIAGTWPAQLLRYVSFL